MHKEIRTSRSALGRALSKICAACCNLASAYNKSSYQCESHQSHRLLLIAHGGEQCCFSALAQHERELV
eukprot:6198568-Pleurochrysis_carterae.AAC.2